MKFRVAYAKPSLAAPATPDYDAVAKEVLTSNNGTLPDAVFVLGGPSNVLGMQQALSANGYLGLFTNQIQYSPNLVAPAVSAFVYTQTAPTETGHCQRGDAAARDRRAEGRARTSRSTSR